MNKSCRFSYSNLGTKRIALAVQPTVKTQANLENVADFPSIERIEFRTGLDDTRQANDCNLFRGQEAKITAAQVVRIAKHRALFIGGNTVKNSGEINWAELRRLFIMYSLANKHGCWLQPLPVATCMKLS